VLSFNRQQFDHASLVLRPCRSKPEGESMVSERGKMSRVAVVVGTLFTACGGGASESEFVAACMKEGQSAASQLLDKELGVTRDAFCKCGAGVAKSSLSGDGYKAMILDMEGKGEEARTLTSKMSESDQQAMLQVAAAMIEKCAAPK
jgi:hypothetical protein